jgi:hypothetical protein
MWHACPRLNDLMMNESNEERSVSNLNELSHSNRLNIIHHYSPLISLLLYDSFIVSQSNLVVVASHLFRT